MFTQWLNEFRGPRRPSISHPSSESDNVAEIPDNCNFILTGRFTTVTEAVGRNVQLTISENSSLTITGNIGGDCKILKEGSGTLTIEGIVANDLELTVYGQGNVIFTRRPPENVIHAIKRRGSGEIICAGVTLPQSSHRYMRNNLGNYDLNQPASRQSVQPIQPVQTTQALRLPSTNRPPAPSSQTENLEYQYRKHTQDYIESFKDRETIAKRIAKLNLSKEEEPLFEGFIECITCDYFNEVPVRYNGRYYNLSTLLELYKDNKPDPFERSPLILIAIDDARDIYDNLEKVTTELIKKRAEAAALAVTAAAAAMVAQQIAAAQHNTEAVPPTERPTM